MLEENSKFQIHAKRLFLTYPKKEALKDKKQVYNWFIELFKKKKAKLSSLIVSFEQSDEEHAYEHFHVYLEADRTVKITSASQLDIEGVHGEYQAVRKREDSIKYVKKDGDFLSLTNDPTVFESSRVTVEQFVNWLIERFHKLKNFRKLHPETAFGKLEERFVLELDKRHLASFFVHRARIKQGFINYASKVYKPFYFPLEQFNVPEGIVKWVNDFQSSKTLVLIGPSGIGKTELLKSVFNGQALLVRHVDQLKDFDRQVHKALLFDDMSFKSWSREALIHLLDLTNDSGINVKGAHAVIPANVPRAISSNEEIEEFFPEDLTGAIERRTYILKIDMKFSLFKTPPKMNKKIP